MSDQVSITNSALIKIGAQPIMSLGDDSKEARLASIRFEEVKNTVLRMHPWNFAVKRVITSPTTDTPAFGYTFYHQVPSDSLRILAINPGFKALSQEDGLEYRLEGRLIATDSDTLEIKYIGKVDDLTLLDSVCSEAIALYLAWDLAYPIVQDLKLKASIKSDFDLFLRKAKGTDAQEEPAPELQADLWLDSRQDFIGRPLRRDR